MNSKVVVSFYNPNSNVGEFKLFHIFAYYWVYQVLKSMHVYMHQNENEVSWYLILFLVVIHISPYVKCHFLPIAHFVNWVMGILLLMGMCSLNTKGICLLSYI